MEDPLKVLKTGLLRNYQEEICGLSINSSHVMNKINDSAAVTKFIVIPGKKKKINKWKSFKTKKTNYSNNHGICVQ